MQVVCQSLNLSRINPVPCRICREIGDSNPEVHFQKPRRGTNLVAMNPALFENRLASQRS
ncbi:hypothetical protein MFFC18_02280 [Mariniblastus fucicola]|uniref:Uncharacterized protein n=1 Tax=Mariniblastus fucicola TaxID=980251 RepID=A0A5B9P632_9BACT|nr:hypothetical protein MFFC18_02280 [Mariniblastus fucicola]